MAATEEDMLHLSSHTSQLLIIDMQSGMVPAVIDGVALTGRVGRLAQAARLLGVPVGATEHCAGKIGATVPELAQHLDWVRPKTHFNAVREDGFLAALPAGRPRILLTGAEAHVCVLQTGLGLQQAGFRPVLVADGIGSRKASDWQAACARWAHHGLETVTTEMAMFEWLEHADHPQFRQVLALVKANGSDAA